MATSSEDTKDKKDVLNWSACSDTLIIDLDPPDWVDPDASTDVSSIKSEETEKSSKSHETSLSYVDEEGTLRPKGADSAEAASRLRGRLSARNNDKKDKVKSGRVDKESRLLNVSVSHERLLELHESGEKPASYSEAAALFNYRRERNRAKKMRGPISRLLLSPTRDEKLLRSPNKVRQQRDRQAKIHALWNTPKVRPGMSNVFYGPPGQRTPERGQSPQGVFVGPRPHDQSVSSSLESGELEEGIYDPHNLNVSGSKGADHSFAALNETDATEEDDEGDAANKTAESVGSDYYGESRLDATIAGIDSHFTDELKDRQMQESAMDWEDVDEAEIKHLERCRKEVRKRKKKRLPDVKPKKREAEDDDEASLHIVVDTNIFLSQLPIVKTILEEECAEGNNAVVYVPWTVLQELDVHKTRGDEKLKRNARAAVNFLAEEWEGKESSKVLGQSLQEEAAAKKYTAAGNDDLILQTCLQLHSQAKQVLLYTNDKVLGLKARQCGLHATDSARLKSALEKCLKTRDERLKDQVHLTRKSATLKEQCLDVATAPEETSEVLPAFARVWSFLFSYTKFYMEYFNVHVKDFDDLGAEAEFPKVSLSKLKSHIQRLYAVAAVMEERMEKLFKIPAHSLTILAGPLRTFLDSLRNLPASLGSVTPDSHAAVLAPPVVARVPLQSLLEALVASETRTMVEGGLGQLRLMVAVLRECKKKAWKRAVV